MAANTRQQAQHERKQDRTHVGEGQRRKQKVGEQRRRQREAKEKKPEAVILWQTSRRVAHAEDCPCDACVKARSERMEAIVRFREWRKQQTVDLGDKWDVAQHRLVRFMSTTRVVRTRGKPGTPAMKTQWVHHLDAFTLNRAVDRLGGDYPVYGRIIVQYFYNDKTQEEIAEKEHMDQSTVSRYLKAAVTYLGVLYDGLARDPVLLTPTG